ncbi:hypothetical protein BATDEDRAFT_89153 [Batrachochytrium dendrobatidis JAM81]|uniref:Clusterin-associated protein 1 n=2 Tax=Batrachochytrium dendrobatidis TaxID=109871 RepID=F4P424_BATDJ|nr:uncharacterized protein BATDEDRAFT_89153 [Batrachochytrium dendrobatidis JAM81]EGF79754.1 hypothetical protein BATDEDRAFT_89153 [Batrachochytrium dendrobatidis JAM81]OAJ38933.1 hypothetical protein BDEG_22823 [Batrachochytrium dendrobatidis JEL423]|eukprot:XP_006679667.1 hypothetical protein BATDEDRAFT_89153 [Batrachochytrium dendrobatidis JAM81]
MRGLGYPKRISMESFRTPNFDLVSDILYWLVKNYDPSIDISNDISSEQDRVIFVKSIALFMAPKAHIQLNTRKLYTADGYAVKELLKIVNILYEAHTMRLDHNSNQSTIQPLDISNRIGKLKASRTLASEIIEKGAELYDLLGQEISLRDRRTDVISRPFELAEMEQAVTAAVNTLRDQMTVTRTGMDNLHSDEINLLAKIEKKKVERDRAEKRLKSLQGVRPAYMDEYEKIEVELSRLYETYMEKFRNLAFLEQQLDEYNREEQNKSEETESSMKRMQNRLREEELRLLRGEKEIEKSTSIRSRGGHNERPAAAGSRSRSLNLDDDDLKSSTENSSISDDPNSDRDEDEEGSIDTALSNADIVQDDMDDEIFTSRESLDHSRDVNRVTRARSTRPRRAGENSQSTIQRSGGDSAAGMRMLGSGVKSSGSGIAGKSRTSQVSDEMRERRGQNKHDDEESEEEIEMEDDEETNDSGSEFGSRHGVDYDNDF